MQKRIWITWETQRRSIELAKKLGCDLFIIEYEGVKRYPISILQTLFTITRAQPDVLFVQNPSMILATVACIYKIIKRTRVVVDRHSTFLLGRKYRNTPRLILFKLLHRMTIKIADMTIVSNEFLANIVKKLGGKPFTLPDKLPELTFTERKKLKGKKNILLISSFGKDEPIKEVLEAMKGFEDQDIYLYITGNCEKLDKSIAAQSPRNVIFTGFLPDEDYMNILFSVDGVMVLTTSDYCMLCGCYEAVSAAKPLITSNKQVLREYFEGAVFVDNSSQGISDGIREISTQLELYRSKMRNLRETLSSQWDGLYQNLEKEIIISS